MFNRSIFIRIDKLQINTIQDSREIRDYTRLCICYIIKKVLIDNNYNLEIVYDHEYYNIENADEMVHQIALAPQTMNNLLSLSSVIIKNIEQVIHEFNIYNLNVKSILNINSILVNSDSLLITFEVYELYPGIR